MARRRGIAGRIVEGAATILGQLAQFFRLGPRAAVQPPETAEPGRTRLQTPEEIVSTLSARHELPPAGSSPRISVSYIAVYTERHTGERLGINRIQIEADEGTPRTTIDSRARRQALAAVDVGSPPTSISVFDWDVSVRRVATTIIPTAT